MRILIIEDEIIIARFIEQQLVANFTCSVHIALNREEVRKIMPQFLPHLLICDINLNEEKDGIDLIEEIRQSYSFETIFITSYHSKSVIERAASIQPANYIIKPVDEAQIYAGIQLIKSRIIGNPDLGKSLQGQAQVKTLLNPKELEVLRLIHQKKTSKEIAEILFASQYTIKNHRHNICRKLNLNDENNALLKWALQNERLFMP